VTRATLVVDCETFPNSFLLAGKNVDNGKLFHWWLHESGPDPFRTLINNRDVTLVTFNGRWFDIPVIQAAAAGANERELKNLANDLIEGRIAPWNAERQFGLPRLYADHVDLKEVAPSFVSLKAYGARMMMPWLKELPYHHEAELDDAMRAEVLRYCYNDLDTTEELMRRLEEPLKLRVQMSKMYGTDMRSKSDTQMAEAAFIKRLNLKRGSPKIPATVAYAVPHFVRFNTPELQALRDSLDGCKFRVNAQTGHVILPEFLDRIITVGQGTYQMGVGGLHSTHDKSVCYLADKEWGLTDIDAASYYPSILILCDLIPQNTGRAFIDEYKDIYYRRLAAKKSGDKNTANTLKISLNGTFGKTADRFSPLYSPDLMIAITLTGQLSLLVLIERFVAAGFEVASANTDGIAVRYPHKDRTVLEQIVDDFAKTSGFEFEYTPYRTLAMKDVNNYIAITPERKVKAKGLYAPPDLRKNPTSSVVAKAVSEWIAKGTPFESTIDAAQLVEFLSARNVTGGAVQGDVYLGKVVRWYQTTDTTLPPLTYAKNGNKVPKTDGARALMLIENYNELPSDLNKSWYIRECVRVAKALGCGQFLTPEHHAYDPPKVRKTRSKKNVE
jgi:hypothetical protein